MMFEPGNVVYCKGETNRERPGIVLKVGREYVHVDWGTWVKPMLPEHLVKPAVVPMPNLSGDGYTVELIQPGGVK